MSTLIVAGIILLILVAFYYGGAAILEGIAGHKPPGIVHLGYMLLTVLGFFSGLNIIAVEAVRDQFKEPFEAIFVSADEQLDFFIVGLFMVLLLVIVNLMRSYFNLHDIETVKEKSRLGRTVMRLEQHAHLKWTEFSLRIVLFALIAFINKALLGLVVDERMKMPVIGVDIAFPAAFRWLWVGVLVFYVVLIVWDVFMLEWSKKLLGRSQERQVLEDAQEAKKIIATRAMPVHFAGLIASLMMVLLVTNGVPVLLPICAVLASLAGILGVGLFILAAWLDLSRVWETIRGVG